jgi:hypothetical protein
MANVRAIHSVGASIVTSLRNAYPAMLDGQAMPGCVFELMSCGQLAGAIDEDTRIGLLLYRVTMNEHARQTRPVRPMRGITPPGLLSLDLHYLLTAWAANALDEQVAFAWALRQLHLFPVLDASSLSPEAAWSREEVIQLVPNELATEEMMRIWDALDPAYRLSASYVARVVQIEPDEDREAFPAVVASRLAYGLEVA